MMLRRRSICVRALATLVLIAGLLLTGAAQAGTIAFGGRVITVATGGKGPFEVGQLADMVVDYDDVITGDPGNDDDGSTAGTRFFGATSIQVQIAELGFDAEGTPDGVSGAVSGNTFVRTRDTAAGIDSQQARIGESGNSVWGGIITVNTSPDLGDLTLTGLGVVISGGGVLDGLAPDPDPTDALAKIISDEPPSQREIRLFFEVDGDEAQGRWEILSPCTTADGRAMWMGGVEHDTYRRVHGQWLHASMRLETSFFVPYETGWAEAAAPA